MLRSDRGAGDSEDCLTEVSPSWAAPLLTAIALDDECRIRSGHGLENSALPRHLALSAFNQETAAKLGLKNKRLRAGWDDDSLLKVLVG